MHRDSFEFSLGIGYEAVARIKIDLRYFFALIPESRFDTRHSVCTIRVYLVISDRKVNGLDISLLSGSMKRKIK